VPTYSREDQREFLGLLNPVIATLYSLPIPVVGAINGHAVAAGFILALTTDYRVGATGDAQLGLTEARVGIPFPAVPMMVLHAECAPQDVRYTTLFSHTFGSDEAHRRGILDELVPPQNVLERAIQVARDMAGMPSDGYRRVKYQVRQAAIARIQEFLAQGRDPMLEGWLSPEAQQASTAILEAPRNP
jgi:enoyl-CoA hydratase